MAPAAERFLSLVVLVLLSGCTDRTTADAGSLASGAGVVRAQATDSAGTTIRTSPAEALERVAYRVIDPPALSLDGTEEGGEPFHAIGAIAATPNGGFAVAERGAMGVRVYDPDGRALRIVGREGEGPGEFGALNGLAFLGDSMVVFDSRWSRISVFDGEGAYAREIVPRADWGAQPRWAGFSADAGLLTLSRAAGSELLWGVHDLSGEPEGLLSGIPPAAGPTMAMLSASGASGSLPPLEIHTLRPGAAPFAGGVASFSGETLEVRLHAADGSGVLEIWRVADGRGRVVTESDIEAARARALESGNPELRPLLERRWADVRAPERFPALGSGAGMIYTAPPEILESASGELWVHAYPTRPDEPRRWWVFDPGGTLRGSVAFPPRFELHAVGPDGAIGVALDAFDVERVVLYRLEGSTSDTG